MKIHRAKFSRSLLLIASSSALSLPPLSGAWAAELKSLPDYAGAIADSSYLEESSQGTAQVVLPEALPVRLDLSGEDGRDGRDGATGMGGLCYGSSSMNGGNGGDGEDGKDGRDGGSVVVIYRSLADLSQAFVVSEGGKGGRGGRGGAGGSGCYYCPPEQQTPNGETDAFDKGISACVTTQSGISGLSGRDGKDGERGHLYIADQAAGLKPDQPTQSVHLSSFAQNEALSLSRNLWDTREGALSLIAPRIACGR